MDKIYGAGARQDSLEQTGRKKWCLIYGFGKDDDTQESGWNYRKTYDHKPSLEEVKSDILSQINANTDEKILDGMVWNGQKVWLSAENQRTFMMMGAAAYPLTLKIGESEDGSGNYRTFDTAEEMAAFSSAIAKHIQDCLTAGYEEKDNIDWSVFS